jgi:HSP20 family molecular chaperone IbpA
MADFVPAAAPGFNRLAAATGDCLETGQPDPIFVLSGWCRFAGQSGQAAEKEGRTMNTRAFPISPFLLGFDHLEQLLERSQRSSHEGYPPYNVEETPQGLGLTLAVAGFDAAELAVIVEGRQLVIRGRQVEADSKTFLHRGIAARQFLRSFVLADGIEVSSAALANGLLKIDLVRPKAESTVRTIQIKTGGLT